MRSITVSLLSLVMATSLLAQDQQLVAPTVTKVEPPDWWVGHSINPVRLLVRGGALAGARVS